MSGSSLLDHFSTLSDPRQSWKVVYPLPEILLIVLYGTMVGGIPPAAAVCPRMTSSGKSMPYGMRKGHFGVRGSVGRGCRASA